MFLVEIIILLAVIAAAILLVQGTRKVPVQYAKRIVGNKQYGGARQYIPLKVNTAGVMPIIFAQAIMFIPITFANFSSDVSSSFWRSFMSNTGFWYNCVFAILIIVFTYFYTAITVQPNQMAEDMKRNNGFIPGIKPGKTDKRLSGLCNVENNFARFYLLSTGSNYACFCTNSWCKCRIFTILWRYFITHPRRCGIGYIATDRKSFNDASL